MNPKRAGAILRSFVIVVCNVALLTESSLASMPPVGQAAGSAPSSPAAKIPPDQLDSLVAPIALYPDPMLAQVLAASTYPLEIIQLQQWLEQNKTLKDKALADAVAKQPWDPSVQALAGLPEVVKRLADDIAWTTDLGNAFLAQQSDVMAAVQRMRKKAQDKGNLKTTEQQKVETQVVESKSVIVIEQANPQVVYVPTYDPVVVYGPPVYPYPPIYYPPAWYYPAGIAISFGVGVAMGAFWGGGWCCGCGWGSSNININYNNNFVNNGNRNNIGNRPSQLPSGGGNRGNIGGVGGVGGAGGVGGVGGVGGAGGVGSPGGVGGAGGVGSPGGVGGAGGVGSPGGVGGVGGAGGPGGVGGAGPSQLPSGGGGAGTRPSQLPAGGGGQGTWQHNPSHRGGAPYRDRATADRFGGTTRGDSLANRQASARQQISRQGGNFGNSRAGGGTGVSNRAAGGAGAGNRAAGGAGAGNRMNAGGADRIGSRDLSRSGGGNRDAFGGGNSGFNGASTRAGSSRGASSMGSRGGGSRGGGRRR